MENYGKKNRYNSFRVTTMEQKPTLHSMDISKQNKYVMYLSKRLIDSEGKKPLDITDPRFLTSQTFALSNLPKLGEDREARYNFSFTDEQFQEMLSTPKVIFATSEYRMLPSKNLSNRMNVLHLYMLAPWLKDKELPLIYRMDILTNPDNRNFSGFQMSAIVGGFKDGECVLLGTMSARKDIPALYYYCRSGITKRDIRDGTPHEIEGNPTNLYDIADFVFSHCGVKYYQKYSSSKTRIYDIAKSFRARDEYVIPSEIVQGTTGSEFIHKFFDGREIEDNSQYMRELVSIANGNFGQKDVSNSSNEDNLGQSINSDSALRY